MSAALWIIFGAAGGFALAWQLKGNPTVQRWALSCTLTAARWAVRVWRFVERHKRQEPPSGPISAVSAPRPIIPPASGAARRPRWGYPDCVVTGCYRPFARTTERYGPDFGYCANHADAVDGPTWPTPPVPTPLDPASKLLGKGGA